MTVTDELIDRLSSETGRTGDLKGSADTETCGKAVADGI